MDPEKKQKISYETLKNAFLAYVENDAETAEISYVREVLQDVCGLDEDECEELGLGWVY